MTNATKFTFDTIFAESGEILDEPPKPEKRSYLAKEVEEIRKESHSEGARSAQAMADQAIASSLKQLSAVVESLFNVMDKEIENVRREAGQLAFAIGSKIAGKSLEGSPTKGMEEVIDECLGNLRSEPHVHILVHPQNAEGIGARIQETINGRAFSGQLHISPSDGLSETDVRIEWANGGIEKSNREIVSLIASVIDQKWETAVLTELDNSESPALESAAHIDEPTDATQNS